LQPGRSASVEHPGPEERLESKGQGSPGHMFVTAILFTQY